MNYRKIPNTDLEVSEVALGTWAYGGDVSWGKADDAESIRAIEAAIDSGINFIDTAPIYGNGRSEAIIGKAIRGKREKVLIATKCGLKGNGISVAVDLSASFIREEIENSLKRLGVERIDLYQCHWPDEKTPLEETMGELKKLVEEGKIRYIGVSNFDKCLLSKALEMAPVVSDQVRYSLFDREIEKDLIPFCGGKKISVLAYGSLGGGILSGKYKERPSFPKGDARSFFYKFYDKASWEMERPLLEALAGIARSRGKSMAEVAVNWVLSRKEVASCIVGCRTAEQARRNAASSDWKLAAEELREIYGDMLPKERENFGTKFSSDF